MNLDDQFFRQLLDGVNDGVYFVDKERVITFWNKAAERLSGYGRSEMVGKKCFESLFMHLDDNGNALCDPQNCLALQAIRDGRDVTSDVFLHHKNGHRVPVQTRVSPIRDENSEIIGAVEIFNDSSARIAAGQRIKDLEKMAMVDGLTGLANRRFMEMNLHARLAALQRYGWSFGVLFIDIDDFKRVNDTYGHDVGDQVLQMVAKTLQNSLRPFDIVGRWGGEEFLAIVLNTAEEQLCSVANRYRLLIERSGFTLGANAVKVTVSIGATIAQGNDNVASLVKRVDDLLYQSKSAGKNCVSVRANA